MNYPPKEGMMDIQKIKEAVEKIKSDACFEKDYPYGFRNYEELKVLLELAEDVINQRSGR
jgi:hypothetical protein